MFISWDGPDTNYLESLFVPVFAELNRYDWKFHILHFSWSTSAELTRLSEISALSGIPYRAVRIWRTPRNLGALATAILGAIKVFVAAKRWNIDALMPRSVLPLLTCMILHTASKMPIVYDSDGLGVDEKVDFEGLRAGGLVHLFLRVVEMKGLQVASVVLARTIEGKQVLRARGGSGVPEEKFHIVPNGRSAEPLSSKEIAFKDDSKDHKFMLCYVGSVGPQYLPIDMLKAAATLNLHIPNFYFLVLTRNLKQLQVALREAEMEHEDWIIAKTVPASKVRDELTQCHLAISMRQDAFSTKAVQPIKLGDYLLSGLPIIGNSVTTQTRLLEEEGVFFNLEGKCAAETLRWVEESVLPSRAKLAEKCVRVGRKFYTTTAAADEYNRALLAIR